MTETPTWEDCVAAGMSTSEAARARGVSSSAATQYAKRHGLVFRDARGDEANRERARILRARTRDRGPLAQLTPAERAEYDLFRRKKYSSAEALRMLGRDSLGKKLK